MPPRRSAVAETPHLQVRNARGRQLITLGEIVLIHDLKRQGLSVSAIARELGMDRKTVRKHLEVGIAAPVTARAPISRGSSRRTRYTAPGS
jgi:predicted ArsR family transcriptional regulator